jgi:hypothetical protein
MVEYSVIDRWHGAPGATYSVERSAYGEKPIRLQFVGTRAEAQAEVDRLNSFSKVNFTATQPSFHHRGTTPHRTRNHVGGRRTDLRPDDRPRGLGQEGHETARAGDDEAAPDAGSGHSRAVGEIQGSKDDRTEQRCAASIDGDS